MILEVDEIRDEIIDLYKTGGGKTYYVGFKCLGRHYSVMAGSCTDWTGLPGSGKTELLLECCMNQNRFYGHKHLLNMPDAGSNKEIVAKLLHKVSGKQFQEFYYNDEGDRVKIEDRLTLTEIDKLLPRVLDTFKVYTKKDSKSRSKASTPSEFWEYAVENKEKLDIFSAIIDSWNYMKHDTEKFTREDKWLEATLSYRNELAESSGLHFHTIIHPKSEKKNKEGKVVMPDMFSLKGGSEWANNGKSIIIVHREWGSPFTDVKVNKAKPAIVGVKGMTCLSYDVKTAKYYELINGQKKYAEPLEGELPPYQPLNNDILSNFRTEDVDDLPF